MRVLLPLSAGARFHKDVLTHLQKASVGHGSSKNSSCSMLTALTPWMDQAVNVEAVICCNLGSQLRSRHNAPYSSKARVLKGTAR